MRLLACVAGGFVGARNMRVAKPREEWGRGSEKLTLRFLTPSAPVLARLRHSYILLSRTNKTTSFAGLRLLALRLAEKLLENQQKDNPSLVM